MKNIAAIVIALASANVLAETPTLAQPTPASVLVDQTQTATAAVAETKPAPAAAPVTTQEAVPVACCETAQEVKLGPWQARRLARQADRQEARDCCKCECDKKDSRPSALVLTKRAPKCACGCK
jgi:hypothetical protein